MQYTLALKSSWQVSKLCPQHRGRLEKMDEVSGSFIGITLTAEAGVIISKISGAATLR